jgi:hypothetical protein
MSERMTNVEVEDVLASIRRLVLEGTGTSVAGVPRPADSVRPLSPPVARALPRVSPAEPAPDAAGGRLVLTPALRVAQAPEGVEARPDSPVVFRRHAPEPEPESEPAPATLASDPDALRALVAEVVREELAGELGERITRNLRKLVQREIARALAERELP